MAWRPPDWLRAPEWLRVPEWFPGADDQPAAGPTVFVLGGGGPMAAVQVGMLRALFEADIRPDLILGCSAGAINGAAIAFDPTLAGVGRLEEAWRSTVGERLAPPGRLPLALQLVRKGKTGLHPNRGLRQLINEFLGDRSVRFEDLKVPFQCVATSLDQGRARWFATGPVLDPLLASAAIPGIFPPVEIGGERYVDGAVVNDVPISRALQLGAGRLFVLYAGNLDRKRPSPRRPLDVVLESYWIARSARYKRDLENLPEDLETVVVPGGSPRSLRYDDFGHTDELITHAYRKARAFLAGEAVEPEEPIDLTPDNAVLEQVVDEAAEMETRAAGMADL